MEELKKASDRAEAIGNRPMIARIEAVKGWVYSDRGEFDLAGEQFKNWLDSLSEQFPKFKNSLETLYFLFLGFLDINRGQIEAAKSKVKEIESKLPDISPEDRENVKYVLGILETEIFLAEGSKSQAIAEAEKLEGEAEAFYLSTSPDEIILYNVPFYKDVLARAYAANGEIDEAIAAYEDLITFDPHLKERYLVHPVYHYRLAKLYQEKGWTGKAIEQYEKFLDIWKNADPDHPELEDAKKRLAELN
jgi:tetratricopeptide (TPR) repeat protein